MTTHPRTIRVIDLETTGDSFTNGGVVELGWQDVVQETGDTWQVAGGPHATLVHPGHPITPATAAIHHIIDEDVVGAPGWAAAAPPVLQAPGVIALAAHRAAFEQRWCIPAVSGRARWICTWKCGLRVWPDAPTHSNQGLRYWRNPKGLDRATGLPAHRAGPDAYVTAHHLRDLLQMADLDTLLAWSAQPALLVRVPAGPLRARRFADLDDDALDRIAAGEYGHNTDMLFTARAERSRRGGAPDPATAQMPLDLHDAVPVPALTPRN